MIAHEGGDDYMSKGMTIDEKIERLDLSLFDQIVSQTTEEDKRSFLAIQSAIRKHFPGYIYLEIGSYLGGSIQPHAVDPQCAGIISIDSRPEFSLDSRGSLFPYPVRSARVMLEGLGKIPGADVSKIKTFDCSTAELTAQMIGVRPQCCFIDGEHTDAAALGDARFCLSVLAEDGLIAFHDANLIYEGLQRFLDELVVSGRKFRAHVLPDSVFLIEIGAINFCESEPLSGRLRENYKAYLAGMMANHWYRHAYHLPIYRGLRRIRRLFPKRQ